MSNPPILQPVRVAGQHRLPDWTDSVLSDVTPDFVSPLPVSVDETVRIRILVGERAPIRSIEVRAVLDGSAQRIPMRRTGESIGGRACWAGSVPAENTDPLHWHFVIHSDDRPVFYNRRGVFSIPPTEDHDFVVLPNAGVPAWPAQSVFYQIFPDRFANGDTSVGRRPDEYEFDGGSPTVLDWDQEPLEFDEGRCQDFFNGDLAGIQSKLDYLQDLGVNALYLTPIFAARTTHRYDCIDYFSVDPALGGDEALARLTQAMHARGMKLMVDVSINHTGCDHPWFRRAQEDPQSPEARFYYRDEEGRFAFWHGVPTLPQLNYKDPELNRRIWANPDSLVRRWLRPPWVIDAWRFDVADQTARRGTDQLGHELWRNVRRAVKATRPDTYIVGEHWQDNISYLLGDQWDGAMNYFACSLPLRRWIGELTRFEHTGDHDRPAALGTDATAGVDGFELATMIEQHLARLPNEIAHAQLNMLDSHDIHRLHLHREMFDWEIYRGVVMMQFLLPGTPNIWYGDEVGLGGHTRSTEGCRYPMQWDETRWEAGHRNLYRALARLKRDDAVLQRGAFQVLGADTEQLAVARVHLGERRAWLLLLNKGTTDTRVGVSLARIGPVGSVHELDESAPAGDRKRATDVAIHNGRMDVGLAARRSRLLELHSA